MSYKTVVQKYSQTGLVFLLLLGLGSHADGQYAVGESISQATKDRVVTYCANDQGNETIGSLLTPDDGDPTRVLWINFFASW